MRSEVGRGSTFALELPAAAEVAAGARLPDSASPPPAMPAAARILLVDDDAGVRNATAMLLKIEGFEVACAGSLAEAIHEARSGVKIDLVIADYHLQKGETGVDVIAAVRRLAGESLAAVLVSGDTSSKLRGLAHERLRVASKPIRADELLRLIGSLLV